MKAAAKNIGILILSAALLFFVYSMTYATFSDDDHTSNGATAELSPQEDVTTVTGTPPSDSISSNDEDDLLDTPTVPSTSATPVTQGDMYTLPSPKSSRIGSEGLLPGTPIYVVKNMTVSRVEFDSCTVSFSLPASMTNAGRPWALTAGHCGKPGQKVYSKPTGKDFSTAQLLGTIRYSSQGDETKGTSDWGIVSLIPKAQRPQHSTNIPLVLDTYPRSPGERVCKRGLTTGFTCGENTKDDVRVNIHYGDNDELNRTSVVSQAQFCALPGDSGAPIFDKTGIVGILSSTSASPGDIARKQCPQGGFAYYTPINKVLEEMSQVFPSLRLS